jgi:ABC-type multidrug transport system, ATPase component
MNAITAYELTKQYGYGDVVHRLNLQIEKNMASAIVGEAGCGKTTLLRLFAGLMEPTTGECNVMGYLPHYESNKLHAIAGVVTDTAKLYTNMTIRDNLHFFASLHDIDNYDAVDRVSFLLKQLGIWDFRDDIVEDCPTNVKQRANIGRALIHSPKLLMIDEPTNGLDFETTEILKKIVNYIISEEEATVLLCTRHFEHAERICDYFAVLQSGILTARGDLESLRKRNNLQYKATFKIAAVNSRLPAGFKKEGEFIVRKIRTEDEMPRLVQDLTNRGYSIFEAKIVKPTLHDIYNKMNTNDLLEAEEVEEIGEEDDNAAPENETFRQYEQEEGFEE